MFPCLGNSSLDWVLFRVIFNSGSVRVPCMVKTLPGNSHWGKRLQSITVIRHWAGTSHLHSDFAFSYQSLVSYAVVCVATRSQGEILQSSTAFAGLSMTTLDHHFPLSHGHLKKQILICGYGERRQNLLHPPFHSFAFCLCTEGGFSSERAQVF